MGQRARRQFVELPVPPGSPTETPPEPLNERRPRHRRARPILAAVLGAVAVLAAGWVAFIGVRAQVDARLIAAGAGANAGLISVESEQLTLLRALTFTAGAGAALATENAPQLNTLITPLQANSGVPMVDAVLPDGQVIFAVRSVGAPRPVSTRAGLPAIAQALRSARGAYGGRFSEIVTLREGPMLLTIGPALNGTQAVGVFMVMTPLADVLGRLSAQSGVSFTAYGTHGVPIATTEKGTPPAVALAQATQLMAEPNRVDFRASSGGSREALGRLIVLHRPESLLGAAVPDDSWETELWVDLLGAGGLAVVLVLLEAVPSWRRRRASSEGRIR